MSILFVPSLCLYDMLVWTLSTGFHTLWLWVGFSQWGLEGVLQEEAKCLMWVLFPIC